jgi:hypothetical protein
MKFPINQELNDTERKALIKALDNVAEKYFSAQFVPTSLGICAAAQCQGIENATYLTMDLLMEEILEQGLLAKYTNGRNQWEQRATMCLFLVEYLKDTVK